MAYDTNSGISSNITSNASKDTFSSINMRSITLAIENLKGSKVDLIDETLKSIAEYVKSEDSELAIKCTNLANAFASHNVKFMEILDALYNDIDKYIYDTVHNETTATDSMTSFNKNISDVYDALNNININQ